MFYSSSLIFVSGWWSFFSGYSANNMVPACCGVKCSTETGEARLPEVDLDASAKLAGHSCQHTAEPSWSAG